MNAADTTRSLYLELAALGCDMTTGEIDEPVIRAAAGPVHTEMLLARIRAHTDELRALIAGQGCKDLDAIREEGKT